MSSQSPLGVARSARRSNGDTSLVDVAGSVGGGIEVEVVVADEAAGLGVNDAPPVDGVDPSSADSPHDTANNAATSANTRPALRVAKTKPLMPGRYAAPTSADMDQGPLDHAAADAGGMWPVTTCL